MEDEGREGGKRSFNAEKESCFPCACRQLTVLFPKLRLVGGKGPSCAEEESSALLPVKGRQIKAAQGTHQPRKEIEACAIRTDVTRRD